MIDEKEIERLRRAIGSTLTGPEVRWASDVAALLDEVERLRGERDEAREDLETESQWLTDTRQMLDDANAQAAAMVLALDDAYRQRDLARAQAAAQQTVIDRSLKVTPHAETCICVRCRLTIESGRDILDALAKAEAAHQAMREALGIRGGSSGEPW